jgi:hypothetical protein
VPDHGLDGLPALEQLLQRSRQPPGVADQQSSAAGRLHAAVAAVDQRDLRSHVGQDFDLLELAVHGVPVVGVARHRAHAHDEPLLGRHRHRDLHAELVGRPGLALGQAFDLGRV